MLSAEWGLTSLLSTRNSKRAKRPASANGTVLPHAPCSEKKNNLPVIRMTKIILYLLIH